LITLLKRVWNPDSLEIEKSDGGGGRGGGGGDGHHVR